MSTPIPIVRNDGEGERLWFYGGGLHIWKATGQETDGAFILFEDLLTRGKTTPLHSHPSDELMYVLEGEVIFHIDGTDHRIGALGTGLAPRGTPHAFMVTSEVARVLFFETPASAEAFYRGASEPATDETVLDGPIDMERVQESARRNGGIEILGPPPFVLEEEPGA